MSVLQSRWLHPDMATGQAMAAVGGLWLVEYDVDRAAVIDEVNRRRVRALEVVGDLAFVASLPDLEFLIARDPPDVGPVHALSKLRLLALPGTWDGLLDGGAWPSLEWFEGVETPREGGGVETLFCHPTLRSLALGRARLGDLEAINALRLESLSIARSMTLTGLAGIEALASTLLDLTLSTLPALESLGGLETLTRLEVLHLDVLRHVTTLDLVAQLPRLRFLDVFDQKQIASLGPLARHATLEYVAFGRTVDLDLEPLFTIPNLKLVLTGARYRWNRDVHDLPYLHDVPPHDPRRVEWNRLAVR